MTEAEVPKNKKVWMLRTALIAGLVFFVLCFALSATDPPFHYVNPKFETDAVLEALSTACVGYLTDNGPFPRNLDNHSFFEAISGANPKHTVYMSFKPRQVNNDGELIDAWGTPFRISYISNSNVSIISAGPDKIFGTADDITNQ